MAPRHPLSEVPPDEFVAARNALVRKLRERGETEEAQKAAALRKPSTPLWIVNQLGRRAPDAVEELIASTQRARGAQVHPGPRDDLRAAMQAQRQALHALMAEAEKAAAGIGTRITPEIQRRIHDTLQTAAAAHPQGLREGALEEELSAAGFSALLAGATAAAARAGAQRSAFQERTAAQKQKLEQKRDALLRRREIEHAGQTARRLQNRARQLEQMALRAQSAAEAARDKAREARAAADAAAAKLLQLRQ